MSGKGFRADRGVRVPSPRLAAPPSCERLEPRLLLDAGLTAEYFDDVELTDFVESATYGQPIDIATPSPWDQAPPGTAVEPDQMYSVRWSGFVLIPEDGDWTFTTRTNDGVRLYVNDELLHEDWTQHSPRIHSDTRTLAAAWYPVVLEYFQDGGTSVMELSFSGPNQPQAIIPLTHLSTEDLNDTTPPEVEDVVFVGGSSFRVTFSEPVLAGDGPTGAENPANYAIDHGRTVASAEFEDDEQTVLLTVADLIGGQWELTVSGVEDQAGVGNVVAETSVEIDLPVTHVEDRGLSILEAESFFSAEEGAAGHAWQEVTAPAGYAGDAAMQALPDDGADTGDATTGPRLRTWLRFATPNTYNVWVRMLGADAGSDSVHVSFHDQPLTFGHEGMTDTSGDYAWVHTVDGRPAPEAVTLTVSEPGIYSLDVWMREAGAIVDKVLLYYRTTEPRGSGGEESRYLAGDALEPVVRDVQLNPATGRMDALDELAVRFSEDVSASLAAEDLVLRDADTGLTVEAAGATVAWDPVTKSAVWDLADAGAAMGRYTVELGGDAIADAAGNLLDGNNDGTGGDGWAWDFALVPAGDANIDGVVDAADLAVLRAHLGTAAGAGWLDGDLTGDGAVTARDYIAWKRHCGETMPPPPAPPSAATAGAADDATADALAAEPVSPAVAPLRATVPTVLAVRQTASPAPPPAGREPATDAETAAPPDATADTDAADADPSGLIPDVGVRVMVDAIAPPL